MLPETWQPFEASIWSAQLSQFWCTQVLVIQFLLTTEEEAQVSSENERLEGWGHKLDLEEETSVQRCDCSVNTVPGSQPKEPWMMTALIYFGAVVSSKRNQEDALFSLVVYRNPEILGASDGSYDHNNTSHF
ncbi:hypothetical protein DV515_00006451 [Chloebia gouldiae]|uniref:Uncharacterized protein n=1 Tax=Chloebia gouldiae TaxID=44316 RepID=A0A3L8SL81_CHLGU|nr:hypothetical protein DV515_00006451 [Chloebia gouldiae]